MAGQTVNSENCEFGYELISVIPYAYYLHSRGELARTVSGIGSEAFYYFSPRHEINPWPRSWYNVEKMMTPNRWIHRRELDTEMFLPPPYKKHYANDKYHFDLVVYNRYNNEWPGVPELNRPINFFSIDFLRELFQGYKGRVLYCNVDGKPSLYDNAPALPFPDRELIAEFPNVTHIDTLDEEYNVAQMMAFANCPLFLTTNGGGAILASYFGGVNIIYTNPQTVNGRVYARENVTGDFEYYHLFGGSEIINPRSYDEILTML